MTLSFDWPLALVALVSAAVLTALTLPGLIGWLTARGMLDHPTDHSSHTAPVPRGGGLAVAGSVLVTWCGILLYDGSGSVVTWATIGGGAVLLVTAWFGDYRPLPWAVRLAVQSVVVAAALALWPADWLVFQGHLPLWADRLATGLIWVWFITLYNLMDGIDGLAGTETASLGIGLAVVVPLAVGPALLPVSVLPLGLALSGAALAFLRWNWHPAKVFLGGAGSIPLGFLLGFLLLVLAASGAWAAALILPAYYIADATLTLGRRLSEGKPPLGHREHFYQRAVYGRGLRHDQVATRIAVGNGTLIAAALDAEMIQLGTGLAAAGIVLMVLIGSFSRPRTTDHP